MKHDSRDDASIVEAPPSLRAGHGRKAWALGATFVAIVLGVVAFSRQETRQFAPLQFDSVAPPTASVSMQSSVEEQPPVGVGQKLTANQLRYCLDESVRILAEQEMLDGATKAQSRRYNAHVVDFNSRCSRYSYDRAELFRVRAEVDAIRDSLKAQGRKRLR